MTRVLLRFDAGPRIGGGHASRCLNLADALAVAGAQCTLATVAETLDAFPRVKTSGHEVHVLTDLTDHHFGAQQFDLAVLDHYQLGPEMEDRLAPAAARLVVIDDLLRLHPSANAVVDQTHGRSGREYDGRTAPGARHLTGSGYAMIHPAYREARARGVVRDGALRRILVTFGAADPKNAAVLALTALRKFLACHPQANALEIDLIIGRRSPGAEIAKEEARRLGERCRLHIDPAPTQMAELCLQADLAIGAGGVSSWERCCSGLPTLAIELGEDQRSVITALAAEGAVFSAGLIEDLNADKLCAQVAALSDPDKRAAMSRAAFSVCDGDGAARVAVALLALYPAAPYLRRATRADAEVMFSWQTPEIRRFFRNPKPPGREEHIAWLNAALADPGMSLNIILSKDDQPAGVLRLDRKSESETEVSILVAPAHQGQGIGKAALRQARYMRPGHRLSAFIAPENAASLALFRSLFYRDEGKGWLVSEPGQRH